MYLGLDFGTSSVKGVLIDAKQKIVATASAPLKVSRPQPGWSEQNPEDWWKACNIVVKTLGKMKPKAIAAVEGIGLSGQQHGATLLGKDGKVLRPCILWNDARSFRECDDIETAEPRAREISGNIPLAGFTAPKLLWVKKHEPKVFAQVAKVLLPKDYIRLRMTGEYASDMSDSSGTYWLDCAKRDWSDKLLAAGSMSIDQMPKLYEGTVATGRLTAHVAKAWGMPKRPVVAGGGGDNAAAACGIGAVTDNSALVSIGTSGVMFVSNDTFRPNAGRALHAFCHAVPGTWHQMGVILSAAASLEWLATILSKPAPKLTAALGTKLTGPSAALMLPYLSGERTPHNNPHAKGVLFGLTPATTPEQVTQAVLEGVALSLADAQGYLAATGPLPGRIAVNGGGSKSRFWMKILASTLNKTVLLQEGSEAGPAFGAARLARLATTGEDVSSVCTKPGVAAEIAPDPALAAAYAERLTRFRALYRAVAPLF